MLFHVTSRARDFTIFRRHEKIDRL